MTPRKNKRPTRLAERRRKRQLFYLLAFISVFIMGYAGLGFALTLPEVRIQEVHVRGTQDVSADAAEATVWQQLAGVRAGALYAGTIASYNKSDIIQEILFEYPRVASVSVRAQGLNALLVEITEREAVAQWCGIERCYAVDRDGFIFAELPMARSDYVRYSSNLAGEPLRQTLLRGDFPRVRAFVDSLTLLDIEPQTVELSREEITVYSATHPRLDIKYDEHLERSCSYLEATLDSAEYQAVSQGDSLEYIDLRFGNRVYYK